MNRISAQGYDPVTCSTFSQTPDVGGTNAQNILGFITDIGLYRLL